MNPFLQLAIAEGGDESTVPLLLAPDLDPTTTLASPPPELPARVRARLLDPTLPAQAELVARRAHELGLMLLTPADPEWPEPMQTMPLRPLVLFARGDLAALRHQPSIAIVGSRTPTPYGSDAARAFANALAGAGVAQWSGLARGVDGIAHRACLDAKVPTVAVLAGGLDRIYPPEHRELAEQIVRHGGCLLSELPPGRQARRGHFPRRNRVLAAGAAATLVIEASLTSGALHTARFAAEQGQPVFAVPGPWASERSQGCHRLIAEGAQIAENPELLLRELGVCAPPSAATGTSLGLQTSADEQAVLRCLAAGPRPADLVARESGLDREAFLTATFALEGRGLLLRAPGALLVAARAEPFTR
ncbi:MAG: DNA-protecting protein DprA [Planctomycetes bacterium]|nr:DNA-protecting protein DprA [Planctomycetota bacterium]